jgi:hypothetical protein
MSKQSSTTKSGVVQQRTTVTPNPKSASGSGIKEQMTDSGATDPRPMSAAQHNHFQEIAGHLLENSARAGHGGHALGKAGPGNTGHTMPPSDSHLQKGAYLPQGVFAQDDTPQNRQNQSSRDGGAGFDDPSAKNYGTVDTGD